MLCNGVGMPAGIRPVRHLPHHPISGVAAIYANVHQQTPELTPNEVPRVIAILLDLAELSEWRHGYATSGNSSPWIRSTLAGFRSIHARNASASLDVTPAATITGAQRFGPCNWHPEASAISPTQTHSHSGSG